MSGRATTSIARLKTQQYETRKNDEFQALGHEIERYEKEIQQIEDQELELMEQADKLKAEIAAEEKKARATKESITRQLADLEEKGATLESALAGVDEGTRRPLPKRLMKICCRFDRLVREQRRRRDRCARARSLHRLSHEGDDANRGARQRRQRNRQLRAVRADSLRRRNNLVGRRVSPAGIQDCGRAGRC